MKVYSDILTTGQLYDACPAGVALWQCDPLPRCRVRARGWSVSLTGSSPYVSQMGDTHKAATWDEHGTWMDRLFDIDPHARISRYDGRDDFIGQTQEQAHRYADYYGPDNATRRGYDAPWLEGA